MRGGRDDAILSPQGGKEIDVLVRNKQRDLTKEKGSNADWKEGKDSYSSRESERPAYPSKK